MHGTPPVERSVLSNRFAVVIGAGNLGLAYGIAQCALTKYQMKVILCDIDEKTTLNGANKLKNDFPHVKHNVFHTPVDLTKTEMDLTKALAQSVAPSLLDDIALVVNCAAIYLDFAEPTLLDWDLSLRVNLLGAIYLQTQLIPFMLKQRTPSYFCQCSSLAGWLLFFFFF